VTGCGGRSALRRGRRSSETTLVSISIGKAAKRWRWLHAEKQGLSLERGRHRGATFERRRDWTEHIICKYLPINGSRSGPSPGFRLSEEGQLMGREARPKGKKKAFWAHCESSDTFRPVSGGRLRTHEINKIVFERMRRVCRTLTPVSFRESSL
jgi:hypothetical protein